MRKIFLIFILSFSVRASLAQQAPQRIRFEHLTVADGLPENSVTCMLQDHLGFMWLGTQNGLARYDGNRITSFPYRQGDPYTFRESYVSTLLEDQHGDVWIGAESLFRFERTTQRFIEYPDKYISPANQFQQINFVHEDKQGRIWTTRNIDMPNMLSRFDPKSGSWTYFSSDQGNPHYLADNGLSYYNALAEDKDGKIWVITRNQYQQNTLQTLDPKTDKFIPYHPKISAAMAEDFKKIIGASLGDHGMIYLSTDGKGFFILNTQTGGINQFRHNAKDPGSLSSDSTGPIYSDKSGFVWIPAVKVLDRYDPATNTFTHYNSKPGDSSTHANVYFYDPCETPGEDIWFKYSEPAEVGMSFYQRKTHSFTWYKSDDKREDALWGNEIMLSSFVDRSGMLWSSSRLSGLNKESRISQFPLLKNIPGNDNSLQNDNVNSIYEAPSEPGIIWFGSKTGLDRYDKKTGKYTHYRHDDRKANSISKGMVTSFAKDNNGRFWVGTDEGGLNLMDRKK